MKNQYAGDVNDFRKYAILRALASCRIKISICWMLTADDSGSDGRRVRYLQEPKTWARLDPELYASLGESIARTRTRSVADIEKCVLLDGFRFYGDPVPPDRTRRAAFLTALLEKSSGTADLIFFDPDNGVRDRRFTRSPSEKHLYWHEVTTAFAWGFSVVFYQHFPRLPRNEFIGQGARIAAARTGATCIYSFQTPDVVFFLIAQDRHRENLSAVSNAPAGWGEQIRVRVHSFGSVRLGMGLS